MDGTGKILLIHIKLIYDFYLGAGLVDLNIFH